MCHPSDCGCERHAYKKEDIITAEPGGCSYHGYSPWHFSFREQASQEMEDYLKQLQTEASDVQGRLSEIKEED